MVFIALLCGQYSRGSALGAICGRGDIDPARPRAAGCYDTCVTNWKMGQQLAALGVNGPPGSAEGLIPFQWSAQPQQLQLVAHRGQPDLFDFVFEELSPEVEPGRLVEAQLGGSDRTHVAATAA